MSSTHRRSAVAVVLLSSIFLGCDRSSPTDLDGVSFELATAAQKWQRAGLRDYVFESAVSCFCPIEYIGPHIVTVRRGVVTAVANKVTGAPVPIDFRAPIDSVFSFLREEQLSRPQYLAVTFDAELGYPRSIKYGTPENDAGGFITISKLTAVAP
jgi:hypothetical protein